jgi:uncharacterized membrane protein
LFIAVVSAHRSGAMTPMESLTRTGGDVSPLRNLSILAAGLAGGIMKPEQLSHELRRASGPHLKRRRGVVGLSLAAAGSMGVISLYQMGIIGHLPEPPLPGLDADKVDASGEAYEKLSAPDAVIGLASYSATALLAAAGEADRPWTKPWLPLALGAKVAFDAAQAAKLTWDQWAKHRAFCSWCLLAAGATFSMLPLVVPEVRTALRHLCHNSSRTIEEAPTSTRHLRPAGATFDMGTAGRSNL